LAADHGIESASIAIHLGFVPEVLRKQQLGFLRVVFRSLVSGLTYGSNSERHTTSCNTTHELLFLRAVFHAHI